MEKQTFVIEKGEIPMAYLMPVFEGELGKSFNPHQESAIQLLKQLKQFRKSMKKTSDSVKLLKEMRNYGR